MSFKRLLRNFFRRHRTVKELFPDSRHPIVPVFEVGGVMYYKVDSEFNMNCERALKCITFYQEMNQRVDREYLLAHTKAMTEKKKKGQLTIQDVTDIFMWNDQLAERLNWIMDSDLIYKLASVVYFDENEDPQVYDFEYNRKKIDLWKKNTNINSFFLSKPITELVPYLKDYEGNLEEYTKMAEEIKKQQLANLSPKRS